MYLDVNVLPQTACKVWSGALGVYCSEIPQSICLSRSRKEFLLQRCLSRSSYYSRNPETLHPQTILHTDPVFSTVALHNSTENRGKTRQGSEAWRIQVGLTCQFVLWMSPSCLFVCRTVFLHSQTPKWTWSEEGDDEEEGGEAG